MTNEIVDEKKALVTQHLGSQVFYLHPPFLSPGSMRNTLMVFLTLETIHTTMKPHSHYRD